MADRPILFSAPMVRALLDGRKTQTRRLLPHPEYYGCPTGDCPHDRQEECNQAMRENTAADLRFAIGDRLWVKETWHAEAAYDDTKPSEIPSDACNILYRADDSWSDRDQMNAAGKTRVSIFMPRWASRLTLTVTDVRVERLQDCSEADAIAEGVRPLPDPRGDATYHFTVDVSGGSMNAETAVLAYRDLWNSINGAGAWDSNPWIVALTFTVERKNIDTIQERESNGN